MLRTCLDRFRQPSVTVEDLLETIKDADSRKTERLAARLRLMELWLLTPISAADEDRTRRFYRYWYGKPFDNLLGILTDPTEHPDRREAARQRLRNNWGIGMPDSLVAYERHG